MATIDRQVSASSDDTREFGSGFFDTTQTWFHTQSYNDVGSANYRTSGCRFLNITAPKDSTIGANTYLEFYIWANDDPNFKIYGEAIDNAPTFADSAGEHVLDRARTTAFASYVGVNVGTPGWYGSAISVQSIVQELVNRPGWASGQAMAFLALPNTDIDSRVMNAYAWDQTGNVLGPKLHIEYSSGWTGTINRITNPISVNRYAVANISKINRIG